MPHWPSQGTLQCQLLMHNVLPTKHPLTRLQTRGNSHLLKRLVKATAAHNLPGCNRSMLCLHLTMILVKSNQNLGNSPVHKFLIGKILPPVWRVKPFRVKQVSKTIPLLKLTCSNFYNRTLPGRICLQRQQINQFLWHLSQLIRGRLLAKTFWLIKRKKTINQRCIIKRRIKKALNKLRGQTRNLHQSVLLLVSHQES